MAVVGDDAPEIHDSYRARLVLVRPDQFIAWTGDQAPDPKPILRRATGHEAVR